MRKILLAMIISLLTAMSLSAHPHILLLTNLDFIFSGHTCKGVWIEWGFDRFFSSMIIQDYDINQDGKFDTKEIQQIHDHAFINLKRYGYFVFFRKGDNRKNPHTVTDFSARQEEEQLFYKFFIPLDNPDYKDDFYLSIFDPTYYCAVKYREDPVRIEQSTGAKPFYELLKNKKYPVYYNPYGAADDTTSYSKWKPGLETAYPEEVHLFFEK